MASSTPLPPVYPAAVGGGAGGNKVLSGSKGAPKHTDTQMMVVSTDELPGYNCEALGHVFGLTVRSRNVFANIGAGLKSVIGGELGALTKNMEKSREVAMDRMIGMALARGANAIVGFRFDSTAAGAEVNEVCAYGTAVKAVPK